MEKVDLEKRFAYYKPKNQGVADWHQMIRDECLKLADIINEVVPEGREKALAITHLEEVMMWSNAGIARNN